MHFEILVEDQSGKKALEVLVPKIIGSEHTFSIHSYKGVGRIPKNMRDVDDASERILLNNLPKLLKGYGRTFAGYPDTYCAAVIVVCDVDDKCLKEFRESLIAIQNAFNPKPTTGFCIVVEEGEAWFLGDMSAIKSAYPKAKDTVLGLYVNDSICGTWEKLADAIYPGGAQRLSKLGWQTVGREKAKWAEEITPHMDVRNNKSASFCHFRDKLLRMVGVT